MTKPIRGAEIDRERDALRKRAQEDLWFFAYTCCGFEDIDNPFHREITVLFQRRVFARNTLWLMPRGHLKTSLFTIAGNLWTALKYPTWRYLIGSANQDDCNGILADVRKVVETNESYRWLFPEYCYDLCEDTRLRRRCIVRGDRLDFPFPERAGAREGSFTAGSSEGDLTGKHFEVRHYDDIINEKNSMTVDGVQKQIKWFRNQTGLNHSPETIERYIGTRWHYADAAGAIIKDEEALRKEQQDAGRKIEPMYLKVVLSAWRQDSTGSYLLDAAGERIPTWASRFPNEELERLKRKMGSSLFSSQYENKPVAEEDATFKASDIQITDDYMLPADLATFIAVDLADDETVGGDWIVATVASFDEFGKMYVRDMYRTRSNSVLDLCNELWRLTKKWRPLRVGIEVAAYQNVMIRHYKRQATEEGWNIPWQALEAKNKAKQLRIRGLQPRVERHDFHVVRGIPHADALIEEMTQYPRSEHDDILDTLAYLEQMSFVIPRSVVTTKPKHGTVDEMLAWADGLDTAASLATANPDLHWRSMQ